MGLFDRLFGSRSEETEDKELTPAAEPAAEPDSASASAAEEPADALDSVPAEPSPETDQSAPASSLERAMEILRDKEKRAAAIKEAEERQARLAEQMASRTEQPAADSDQQPVPAAAPAKADQPASAVSGEPAAQDIASQDPATEPDQSDSPASAAAGGADQAPHSEADSLLDADTQAIVSPGPVTPAAESALPEGEGPAAPAVPESVADSTPAQPPVSEPSPEPEASPEPAPESTREKYERSLKKTRTGFGAKLNAFFANFRTVDEEFFEDLEELLITSDVGVQVATQLTEDLRQEAKLENVKRGEELRRLVIEKLVDIYEKDGDFRAEQVQIQDGLTVMLFVGVNGVGKTTSIGKLAHQYKQAGKKVMLVAADTFRAGAVAQLEEWARRVDVAIVTGPEKSDPASVVFDGMERALAEGVDILMIDTAGRLQNKDNLMAELAKIGRIIKRVLPDAPHESLLALDASTGQNALSQAKEFSKITPLTGIVLTKIDGTARGGVVLAIRQELDIPVKLIGFGEKLDDIGQFNSEDFMRGLLEGLL